jgi:anti-sigma B factor antagonist
MMTKANVKMDLRMPSDTIGIIDIQGEINTFAENALMDTYTRASSQGAQTIMLNFENLEYMNSGGIGLLVTLLIRAQRQGQQLMACNLSDHYQQIFDLTRLNEAITIYPDERQALAAMSPS